MGILFWMTFWSEIVIAGMITAQLSMINPDIQLSQQQENPEEKRKLDDIFQHRSQHF
jgi:hypothetical protein